MTAAVYTRISRDDLDDGLGVARQEVDCRALAVRRGQSVQRIYSDNDTSAFSGRRRPAYAELCDAIRDRTVSTSSPGHLSACTAHPANWKTSWS